MLRKMVGWIKIPEEPWNLTMRRISMKVQDALKLGKVKLWSIRLAEMQWKYLGRIKNLSLTSWQSRAAFWQPQEVEDESCEYLPNRVRGRPLSRWDDRVSRFSWNHFGKRWQDVPHADFFGALEKFVGEVSGA